MQLPKISAERLPMVWFLSGLLLNALALLQKLDSSFAITALIVGWFCCAFGIIVFVLQLQERPTKSSATRLSSEFISAGSTVQMPAMPKTENE